MLALLQEKHRRSLKRSFRAFIGDFSQEPPPARHHELLIEKLQGIADGKIKRLMVFMPPGSAKSTYASVLFPAFMLARGEKLQIIAASHTAELADRFGRRVRAITKEPGVKEYYGVTLSGDSQAASRWALSQGSEYYGVGVGGSVTGFRADGLIIDDPVKSREEADSETKRRSVREWYKGDAYTRLKPEAWQIIIMTRWHEEDLAGWLIEEMKAGGQQWEVLSLPMEAEENDPLGRAIAEPLWPEWFTDEMRAQAKRDPRNWAALYQQRPAPDSGNFFDRDWLRYYDTAPVNLRKYGASDYAVTSGGGDYTVHGVFGLDPDDNIFVLDWWRGQTESLTWVEQLILMIKAHRPAEWFEEGGQIRKSMDPLISKRQQETQAYCVRTQITRTGSKEMSAQSIRGRMQQGKVYLPKNATWVADLISELMTFPAGKHDDQVDVLALLGMALANVHGAKKYNKHRYRSIGAI